MIIPAGIIPTSIITDNRTARPLFTIRFIFINLQYKIIFSLQTVMKITYRCPTNNKITFLLKYNHTWIFLSVFDKSLLSSFIFLLFAVLKDTKNNYLFAYCSINVAGLLLIFSFTYQYSSLFQRVLVLSENLSAIFYNFIL